LSDDQVDRRIAALAKRQHGYITHAQLISQGLGRGAIQWRIKIGRLIPVYHGVYAVGHLPTHPVDRAYAALLACGESSDLGYGTAMCVWGLWRRWEIPFEVIVPSRRTTSGVKIHRALLTAADRRIQLGLRVTSPARTLLDMTPRLTDKQLRRGVNKLRLEHGLTPEQIADVVTRLHRHPGVPRLEKFAEMHAGPTRSDPEDKFVDFCKRFGLPEPLFNETINGREVDAFFPIERVIVEIDGYDVHAGRVSFEDDRDRDADMLAADLPTVRVTEDRMDNAPEKEAKRLRAILALRRRHAA
jgi:hypothetical protein